MIREDIQSYYVCGQCKGKIFHLTSEKPTIPCPNCGWHHSDKLQQYGVPSEFKIDLRKYGG